MLKIAYPRGQRTPGATALCFREEHFAGSKPAQSNFLIAWFSVLEIPTKEFLTIVEKPLRFFKMASEHSIRNVNLACCPNPHLRNADTLKILLGFSKIVKKLLKFFKTGISYGRRKTLKVFQDDLEIPDEYLPKEPEEIDIK